MFCKYRDIIGKVGEGIHSYRLFNIAVLDVVVNERRGMDELHDHRQIGVLRQDGAGGTAG